jgi:hypothetical protein
MSEALRLTFVQRGAKVELRSVRRIRMRVPPGARDPQAKVPDDAIGEWIELRGAKGETLYRRFVSELVQSDLNLAHAARGQPMRRARGLPQEHVFTVLVPYREDARQVLVVQRRRRAGGAGTVAAAAAFETVHHADIDLTHVDVRKEGER